jgi:hypothetical protein
MRLCFVTKPHVLELWIHLANLACACYSVISVSDSEGRYSWRAYSQRWYLLTAGISIE